MFMARIDSTFRSSLVLLGWTLAATAQARCANGMNTSIPESTPTTAFTVRTDGTVLAKATGLMWARCPVGQVVSTNACSGTPKAMTWAEAIIAAHASTLAGYTDWRLPNPKEALSIFEDRCDALLFSNHTGPMNIGNPAEVTVLDIARIIKKLTHSPSRVVHKPLPVDDPKVRQPDIAFARRALKCRP